MISSGHFQCDLWISGDEPVIYGSVEMNQDYARNLLGLVPNPGFRLSSQESTPDSRDTMQCHTVLKVSKNKTNETRLQATG